MLNAGMSFNETGGGGYHDDCATEFNGSADLAKGLWVNMGILSLNGCERLLVAAVVKFHFLWLGNFTFNCFHICTLCLLGGMRKGHGIHNDTAARLDGRCGGEKHGTC